MRRIMLNKLKYLSKYVGILQSLQKYTVKELRKDVLIRGSVERYMQLSMEVTLEIAAMIISREGYEKPESHREAILLLGEHGILPKQFAEKFAPAAGLRNILVHGYAEIDMVKLYKHLQRDIKDFDTFARHVVKYLGKKR